MLKQIPLFQISLWSILGILIDQITKHYAAQLTSKVILIPNFFAFELHHNTGIALSIPLYGTLQIVLILIILVFGLYFLQKDFDLQKKTTQILVALILGGALGNLLDRLLYGYVIDFISIWHFPIFNFADIFIFLGICGFLWHELKQQKKH